MVLCGKIDGYVGGNPAKILCSVDEYLKRNMPYNMHTKGMTEKEKKRRLLSINDNMFLKK